MNNRAVAVLNAVALAVCICACGSTKLATPDQMKHEYIKDLPGVTKALGFSRALRFIGENFKSSKAVIDHTDKDAGLIIAKGYHGPVSFGGLLPGMISFTLVLELKDDRARFKYEPAAVAHDGSPMPSLYQYEPLHVESRKYFDDLTKRMTEALMTASEF